MMQKVWKLKRWWKRPIPGAIILLYHRVTNIASDPQLLSVKPQHFAEHLDVLCRDYRPVSLRSLLNKGEIDSLQPRSVAVTFDDGYGDNLHAAKPLLEQSDVPATVFVVAGQVGETREFWWDDLERILLLSPSLPDVLELTIVGKQYKWSLYPTNGAETTPRRDWHVLMKTDPTPRHTLYRKLVDLLGDLDSRARESVLTKLCEWAGLSSGGRPEYKALDAAGLRKLGSNGLVEVGAHTMSHSRLSALPASGQRIEIANAKAKLEEILDQPVTSFAYPFGCDSDYTDETIGLVKGAGFSCACSAFQGWIQAGTDPFQMPRHVVRDWDGDEFNSRLKEWFRV